MKPAYRIVLLYAYQHDGMGYARRFLASEPGNPDEALVELSKVDFADNAMVNTQPLFCLTTFLH